MRCSSPNIFRKSGMVLQVCVKGEFLSRAAFGPRGPTSSKSGMVSVMPPNWALLPRDLPVAINSSLTVSFVPLPRQHRAAVGRRRGAKRPRERGGAQLASGEGEWARSASWPPPGPPLRQGSSSDLGEAGKGAALVSNGIPNSPSNQSELPLCKSCSCCPPRRHAPDKVQVVASAVGGWGLTAKSMCCTRTNPKLCFSWSRVYQGVGARLLSLSISTLRPKKLTDNNTIKALVKV